MSLKGKICLVTGASRGIGRGIAVQLGSAGATVYVTGRTQSALDECSKEIIKRGGVAIPVTLDHAKDKEVEDLFEKIKKEQKGKLDVLVNNAYAGVGFIFENSGKKFWEMETPHSWDVINNVGLRNHYICSTYAARLMVPQKSGLIVNISSFGGLKYLFNVPYGIGKAAVDRMAADCAHELRRQNVAVISLWPGAVKTEEITERVLENDDASNASKNIFKDGESVEYAGMAVKHLAMDDKVMNKSGKIHLTYNLASEYDFYDVDGKRPGDILNLKILLQNQGYTWLSSFIPSFIRIPLFLVHYSANKF